MIVTLLVVNLQEGALRQAFESQLTDLMDEKAFQHRVRFSRSIEAYYYAVKMLSAQEPLIEYLEKRAGEPAPAESAIIKGKAPVWLPHLSFLRSFLAPRYAIVLDSEGNPLELFQNWPILPPRELLALPMEALLQAIGQTHITMIGGVPYLLAAEEVKDETGKQLGLLLLSSPLDEAFMITSNGPATGWNLVALIDEESKRVISSNNQQMIARGLRLKVLTEHYLFTEPKFLAMGGMELNFRFASLVSKEGIDTMADRVMEKEWITQILQACVYMGPFIIIIFWLTRRILRLTTRIEEFSLYDLGYEQSGAPGMSGDQLDVLEQRFQRLTDDIKKRTSQLESANHELEAFAYSVSHDLRAPLRSIDGFSQALDEDYRDCLDEAGHDYLRRVRKAAQRMGTLIDEMLMLSRVSRSEMKMRTVDLSSIVESQIQELARSEPERQVEVVIAKDLNVVGDEGLLQVAMTNLLDNAWKFTSKTAGPKIEFGVVKDGPWQNLDHPTMPVFFVADNGVGFDMGFADKLFGAFQRLHRDDEFPGTGVGLATVQRIIKRHNGKIWAESEPCQGATFYFSL